MKNYSKQIAEFDKLAKNTTPNSELLKNIQDLFKILPKVIHLNDNAGWESISSKIDNPPTILEVFYNAKKKAIKFNKVSC